MSDSTEEKTLVLDHDQVKQKIKRIAFQILENNLGEKVVYLAGIEGQGYTLAQMLASELQAIAPFTVQVLKVQMNKEVPSSEPVTVNVDEKEFQKKSIVLIDDVLNSGRTLIYALKPFLDVPVKKLQVAVLVNRAHTAFPIHPAYTGYELATTLNDHVKVTLGKKSAVYLV
jgi:pyrimidine operon attenuation protein/uracil phosphoribosyltransferase